MHVHFSRYGRQGLFIQFYFLFHSVNVVQISRKNCPKFWFFHCKLVRFWPSIIIIKKVSGHCVVFEVKYIVVLSRNMAKVSEECFSQTSNDDNNKSCEFKMYDHLKLMFLIMTSNSQKYLNCNYEKRKNKN